MQDFEDILEMFEDYTRDPRPVVQEPRNMYSQGQLVRNTVDGSRPGYDGDTSKVYNEKTGHIYPGGNEHSNWWSKNPGKNQHKKSLKNPDYIKILKERISDPKYKNYNYKDLVREGIITDREYRELSKLDIKAQFEGPHSYVTKNKSNIVRSDKIKKVQGSNISMIGQGQTGTQFSHVYPLIESAPPGTQTTFKIDAKMNRKLEGFNEIGQKIAEKQELLIKNKPEGYKKRLEILNGEAKLNVKNAIQKLGPEYKGQIGYFQVDTETGVFKNKAGNYKMSFSGIEGENKKYIEMTGKERKNFERAESKKQILKDLSTPEGRLKFRQIGTVKVLNKILERNNIKICNDQLSNGKGVVCGTKFAERDPNAFLEAIKRNKDATKIINKPGLVKGALKGLSGWAKKELGPMGWIGSIATIDSAFGLYDLGQGKTPLQALDSTLWFLPKSVLKADEKMFKNVYEKAGYTKEDFGEFQKWMKLEDLDKQYFKAGNQLKFMKDQVLKPENKSAADIAYQKEVDAVPDMYKNMGWMYPKLTISSEQEKTGEHPFYGPSVDRYNKILTESSDIYSSIKDPDKSLKNLDYSRKLAAMEQANRKKKLMRGSLKSAPHLLPIFDPFSKLGPTEMKDQSFLYDEYVHPIEGPSVSPEQMRAAGFAEGGLAGLMKKYYD